MTCFGSISQDFEESITCEATKKAGTIADMTFLQGTCSGNQIGQTTNDTETTSITGTVNNLISNEQSGNVEFPFCVLVSTFLEDYVITQSKTTGVARFSFDISGSFTLDVKTEEFTTDSVLTEDVSGEDVTLDAYFCKNDGTADESAAKDYVQGSTLSICVTTDKPSSVTLSGVDMNISPPTGSSSFSSKPIILNDKIANVVLTQFKSIERGSIVQIKTVLVSAYFIEPTNQIVAQGSANYVYSTQRQRELRSLQSNENDSSSPLFGLTVNLKPNEAGIYEIPSPASINGGCGWAMLMYTAIFGFVLLRLV